VVVIKLSNTEYFSSWQMGSLF